MTSKWLSVLRPRVSERLAIRNSGFRPRSLQDFSVTKRGGL